MTDDQSNPIRSADIARRDFLQENAVEPLVDRLNDLGIVDAPPDEYSVEWQSFEDVAKRVAEKIDYELRAAWRRGYNWVHVYHPMTTNPESFEMSVRLVPAYTKDPHPAPHDSAYAYSYDLRDVTREDIREAVERRQQDG